MPTEAGAAAWKRHYDKLDQIARSVAKTERRASARWEGARRNDPNTQAPLQSRP
jgi:hypothetical protein